LQSTDKLRVVRTILQKLKREAAAVRLSCCRIFRPAWMSERTICWTEMHRITTIWGKDWRFLHRN